MTKFSLRASVLVILLIHFPSTVAGQADAKTHQHMESAQSVAKWIDPLVPPNDLFIKGAETPELIPISHCYNVFFRTVARELSNGEEGRRKARSLLRKTGVTEAALDHLTDLARQYESEASVIDVEAETQKARYRAEQKKEIGAALNQFDERKHALALGLLARAAVLIGYLEAQKIHTYLDQVVRRQVTLGGADAARVLNSRCTDCQKAPQ